MTIHRSAQPDTISIHETNLHSGYPSIQNSPSRMDQDAFFLERDPEAEGEAPRKQESLSDVIGLLDVVLSYKPTEIGEDRSWLHSIIDSPKENKSSCKSDDNNKDRAISTSTQDHRSSEESRISRRTGESKTETHARIFDQQDIHRASRRGTSPNPLPENMGNERNTRIDEDPPNERGHQRSVPTDEDRKMAENSNKREEDQAEGFPEEVRGSTPLSNDGESRTNNNGRSMETSSTHSTRITDVITNPSPELEDAVLQRNKRRQTTIKRNQTRSERTQNPELHKSTSGDSSNLEDHNTKTSPRVPPLKNEEPAAAQKNNHNHRKTKYATNNANNNTKSPPTPEHDATANEEGTSNTSVDEMAKLLVSLGVMKSQHEFELSRSASHVFAKRMLKSANYQEVTFNLCGMLLSVEKSLEKEVEENRTLLKQIQEEIDSSRDLHKRFSEYQKEQNSLMMANLSTLHIITDRGGKTGDPSDTTRSPSVFTKGKDNKVKKTRFDPSMEALGTQEFKPDLIREDELRDDIRNPVLEEYNNEPQASNASRLIPSTEKHTLHSLKLVIENSPLSRVEKKAYIKSLYKCRTNQEVKNVMELFEEDIDSLTN